MFFAKLVDNASSSEQNEPQHKYSGSFAVQVSIMNIKEVFTLLISLLFGIPGKQGNT
jgi:hypothetical protein